MRDEAHRFSRRLHHKKEKQQHFSSFLDDIEGIGPVTKKKILERLDKSWSEYSKMSVLELANTFEVDEPKAQAIKEKLCKIFSN